MGGILSIGQSALNTAQVALNTVSHNIANASTPGYTRQETIQATNFAAATGAGFIGQGVQVTSVKRVYSEFLVRQAQDAQAASSSAAIYHQQIGQLDSLLGDTSVGLATELQQFFKSANVVANAPASTAARQTLLSGTQALMARFSQMQARFDDIRSGVTQQAQASVVEINAAAREVAQLNEAIVLAEGRVNGQPANDLRDQRDALIGQINAQIKTSVVRQSDGALNLFVGNGQTLVLGNTAAALAVTPGKDDPTRFSVSLALEGTNQPLGPNSLSGGTLGGLLSFRGEALDAAQNALGRIALGFAASLNAQHRLGLDAYGNPGGDLIAFELPDGVPHTSNAGDGVIAMRVSDPGALTESDYRVGWDGAQYTITRLPGQSAVSFASLPATLDGIEFDLASGTPAAGDSFTLRPTAQAAGALTLAFSDPLKVAAAAPVRTQAAAVNTGSGAIGPASVDADYLAAPLAAPYTLSFSGGTLSGFPAGYPITVEEPAGTTTYPAGSNVPYADGAKFTVGGVSYTFTGVPADGDSFTVSPGSGAGDNRNMLEIANLQSKKLFAGLSSLDDAYGQLVSRVGTQTRAAEVGEIAQAKLLEQAQAARESLSGVNLDEEAAKLLRYQQAYQAAGKVMQIADQLFDTLLGLGG